METEEDSKKQQPSQVSSQITEFTSTQESTKKEQTPDTSPEQKETTEKQDVTKKGHNPVAVANKFIELALQHTNEGLYLLPLIKLPYIAHGLTLALTNKSLCDEEVQVWQYGPVFPSIFYTFKLPKMELRNKQAELYHEDYPFTNNENEIIDLTYKKYGNKNSKTLSQLTHGDGTPWRRAYDKGLEIISNNAIKKYYKEIINE